MLIVCPSCATSYMIDQAAVGPAGRTVRCARCKATWFAGGPKSAPDVTAVDDKMIAEAETQSPAPPPRPGPLRPMRPRRNRACATAADDFGAEAAEFDRRDRDQNAAGRTRHRNPFRRRPRRQAPERAGHDHDAPSLVPPIEHEPLPETANAEIDPKKVESFAARRQRLQARRKQSRRSSRWTAVILVLVAFNVALVGARNEVVRYLPQTASLFAAIGLPVNLRHLKFENVRISKEIQDGVNILIVEGTIVSDASKPVEVPRLRFAARNATGQEVYTWTALPTRSILGPGERMEFRSQIPAPPADASDVMVRFFTAQDAVAK